MARGLIDVITCLQPMNMRCRLLLTFTTAVLCAGATAARAGVPIAATQPVGGLNNLLRGSASVTNDTWGRFYAAGTKSLDARLFEQALQKLDSALNELRRKNVADIRLIETKEAIGRAYLGLEKFDDAERVLTDAQLRATKIGAPADGAKARASSALAETLLARQKFERADEEARAAILNCETPGVNEPRALGRAHLTLAEALAARGLDADAADEYKKALEVLRAGGLDEHDLADADYHFGLLLRAQGAEADSQAHLAKAFLTYDREAQFNKPLFHAPKLALHWEEGNPRSRVVPDQDYPLKYISVNGLRVAATLVRSENVIVALVSIANCSREKKELSLGQVSLQQLAPRHKDFHWVHPTELDTTLEAEHVTELTWRRRWLNHIEKTRRIPGYLKDGMLDVDNFFGNNIFTDRYGQWQTMARNETPIVTREQFLYSPYRDSAQDSADFLSHTPVGTRPTFVDPGDAKTGLVYFQQERFEHAILKIAIGNTVVEIPFDSAGPR